MFGEFFLLVVGIYAFTYYLYDNLKSPICLLYKTWRQRKKPHRSHLMCKYGNWAAVTGSTDGIGKAYAIELARLGFDIVLISRSNIKLKAVAKQIKTTFRVEAVTIECDFSKGADVYANLFEQLAQKSIGILVNNVGVGHNPPGCLSTFSPEHVWEVINVNIGAATQLSRHFIKQWIGARRPGLIVNISSGLEMQPCAFGSVYGGTKAYMRSFTQALQEETKNHRITVQLCSPNFVATKMNSYSKAIMRGSLFVPTPTDYAKFAVSTLGKVDQTSGYFWHEVQNAIWNIFPYRLKAKLLVVIAKYLVDDLAVVNADKKYDKP